MIKFINTNDDLLFRHYNGATKRNAHLLKKFIRSQKQKHCEMGKKLILKLYLYTHSNDRLTLDSAFQ